MTTPPDTPGPAPSTDPDRDAPPSESTTPALAGNNGFWWKFRLAILRVVAVIAALALVALLCTAGAGWYTSRPGFCRSCHIMEPYYVSWEESSHKDVTCIKCHFPPGVGEKVRGKMLGLVQLATYVTSSQGPRPAAEIPDASCLRSGCHENRLLSGRIDFHGTSFDHRPHLEPRRGKQLRCTSCHSQIVQGSHMTVTTTTCFLCHFKDEFFNEGLGTCTRCHQIPEEEFDLGGGVKFDHDLAYEQGVDCENCHGDLIRGNGEVPPERCTVCHNREDDLKRIDDHVFLHQMHVSDHKIDCLDCHLAIHHAWDPHRVEHAASDCTSCHGKQHHEQVDLLLGRGSRTLGEVPGGMAVVGITCPTCHRVEQVSPTGTVLLKTTLETCSACHEPDEMTGLEAYYDRMRETLEKLGDAVTRAEIAFVAAELPADRKAAVESILKKVKADVEFLRAADGIHNLHYASTVTRGVLENISQVCRELKVEEPEVSLPERQVGGDQPATEDGGGTAAEQGEPPGDENGEDEDVAPTEIPTELPTERDAETALSDPDEDETAPPP
jgi:nitrate/TMAO reductase-like tetraheme cytochrome c subunit